MSRIALATVFWLAASSVAQAGGFAAPIVTQVTNLAPIPVVSATINSVSTPSADATSINNGTAPAVKPSEIQKAKPGNTAP